MKSEEKSSDQPCPPPLKESSPAFFLFLFFFFASVIELFCPPDSLAHHHQPHRQHRPSHATTRGDKTDHANRQRQDRQPTKRRDGQPLADDCFAQLLLHLAGPRVCGFARAASSRAWHARDLPRPARQTTTPCASICLSIMALDTELLCVSRSCVSPRTVWPLAGPLLMAVICVQASTH